jgi:SpoIID/LytB domain protein
MYRRPWVLGAAAALATSLSVFALPVARAAVPVLVIDGKGFGHGVGMAQDGAYWMGHAGASTEQILGQFYPGTTLATTSSDSPLVRVDVLDIGGPPASTVVSFPESGAIFDALNGAQSPGFPVTVPAGGSVTLAWDGNRYSVQGGTPTARSTSAVRASSAAQPQSAVVASSLLPTFPSTTTTTRPAAATSTTTTVGSHPSSGAGSNTNPAAPQATSSRPLWAVPTAGGHAGQGTTTVASTGRTYHGAVEATGETGTFRLVDQVVVEDYLKGMGEVLDPNWPPASLRAQAIAARTYALRAMQAAGELCDDQRCQVYLGAQAEYAAMDRAVDDTRNRVLAASGSYAAAVYSANGGGYEATRAEGFGTDDAASYPYLRPAPYPTSDPMPWEVRVALSDIASRLGYAGNITDVSVSKRGSSGRALAVTVSGSGGPLTVTGLSFAAALGLKSTLVQLRSESDLVAPPPPPATGAPLQVLPDAVGQLAPVTAAGAASASGASTTVARARAMSALPVPSHHAPGGIPGWAITLAAALLGAVMWTAMQPWRRRRRTTPSP